MAWPLARPPGSQDCENIWLSLEPRTFGPYDRCRFSTFQFTTKFLRNFSSDRSKTRSVTRGKYCSHESRRRRTSLSSRGGTNKTAAQSNTAVLPERLRLWLDYFPISTTLEIWK